MSLKRIQVTIPAVGSQPVQAISTHTPLRHAVIEAAAGGAGAVFVGDADMATDGSEGTRLDASATVPGRMKLGPFSGDAPANLEDVYFVGTENDLVNILYVRH